MPRINLVLLCTICYFISKKVRGYDRLVPAGVTQFVRPNVRIQEFQSEGLRPRKGAQSVLSRSIMLCDNRGDPYQWTTGRLRETACYTSWWVEICYAVLFGFWSGVAISLTPVCISQVCATEDYGKRNGTTFTIVSIGTLVRIPIARAIQERSGGEYGGLIVFGGVLCISATVAFILARGIYVGWSLKTKF